MLTNGILFIFLREYNMYDDKNAQCLLKCVCTFACVVVLGITIATVYDNYTTNQIAKEAIKAGYEQHLENFHPLWKKTTIEKAEQ
jgi:uncharacterized membrane protein YebE (DUF533 family)